MKKTYNINLNGQVFCIDDDACLKLQSYIDTLESHYLKEEDGREIMADIESRIAELLKEVLGKGYKQVVTMEDGLALSSRNTLLDEAHRAAAPHIYATLRAAVEKSHEMTPAELKAWVTAEVERNPLLKVIYYQSVDALTMQEVAAWSDSERIQGCIAVQAGEIRLIDNICIRS